MKPAILGISALGHDAAAALIDAEIGETLYAIAEERLSNLKHTSNFPIASILAAKRHAEQFGYKIGKVAVSFVPKDFSTGTLRDAIYNLISDTSLRDRLWNKVSDLLAWGDYYQNGSFSKRQLDPLLNEISDEELRGLIRRRISWYYNWSVKYRWLLDIVGTLFPGVSCEGVNHHLTHAVSAFFNSGFEDSCVITWDGQGESQTICVYDAAPGVMKLVAETKWPTSLGILYFGVTNYLGFKLGDEFKVMGMAAYGKPVYADVFRKLIHIDEALTVSFTDSPYYSKQEYDEGHVWNYFTREMDKLVPRRARNGQITQQHFDLAASVQKVFEEFGVEFARKALQRTGKTSLCLAGGVALNGLMNEAIRAASGCKDIFIYPAAGDDGCAVGAAQSRVFFEKKLAPKKLVMPFFGGGNDENEIRTLLDKVGIIYEQPTDIHRQMAETLAEDKIIARFSGRSEFGPRALGNRSILANAGNPEMKDTLNHRIKHREAFRPFAPACMREHLSEYFELDVDAPFMLLITQAKDIAREKIPAAVHADGTSRVQSVSLESNPQFYRTIKCFHELTGVPVVINTSFNINGEAIVETALDALESFIQMDIDFLALEGFWIEKSRNEHLFPKLSDKDFLEIRKKRFQESCVHPLKNLEIYKDYFVREVPYSKKIQQKMRGFLRKFR